jgi:hypothetical protein
MRIPIVLDKSALQGLSPAEASWLARYYLLTVVPPLFAEIHMDLASGRLGPSKAQAMVASLANKIDLKLSVMNLHHEDLIAAELMGATVPLKYTPVCERPRVALDDGGRLARRLNKAEDALERWRRSEITEEDIRIGQKLRDQRDDYDLANYLELLRKASLLDGKEITRDDSEILRNMHKGLFHDPPADQAAHLESCMEVFNLQPEQIASVLLRWRSTELQYLRTFAPYTHFCYLVRGWYLLLIGSGSYTPSTHSAADLEYLYYLPFCRIFASNDKLHKRMAPPASAQLEGNPTTLDGLALKHDLKSIDQHWSATNARIAHLRPENYTTFPPPIDGSITCKLWDQFEPGWRRGAANIWEKELDAFARSKR